jgi:hypothetical protein
MKSVRDKAKEFNPNDKYEKLQFSYLEISLREYMMSTKTEDVENMKKEAKKRLIPT